MHAYCFTAKKNFPAREHTNEQRVSRTDANTCLQENITHGDWAKEWERPGRERAVRITGDRA